ncbi:MAG: hypothetical protein AWM53_01460 [Candidatus Dichloromethanomonas elyunquensis]|nr:MAG: hypothetical protein AWM53_01460 [Candidatus Dichloromethanomonas elyunquensis]
MAVVDVVKYDGTPDILAWKFPKEELGTWTQLIVNESQEAVLFKSGIALDVFGSGRHTLDTANIPLLNKIINLPFGNRSPFTAEVWYINKVYSLDIKWGTQTPVQLQDPKFGIFIPVSSYGQFGVRIADAKKFLVKLVGTLKIFDKDSISRYFRGLYQTKVKDAISSYLVNEKIGILEINASIDKLSEYLKERMEPTLDEYGIVLINFFINGISVPEEDPGVIKLKEALAKRAEMNIIGFNYQQERSFDTLEGAAKNPGSASAGVMGAGLGLGMGVGLGGAVGAQFGGIAKEINVNSPLKIKICTGCGAEMDADKRFCADCGYDTQDKKEKQKNYIICSACGAQLERKMKFCPECGKKYTPCPECGADLPEDAKKCNRCGVQLINKCPQCGAVVGEGTKFCPECGEKLK